MAVRNTVYGNAGSTNRKPVSDLSWRTLADRRRDPKAKRRGRTITILSILLVIVAIFAAVRFSSVVNALDDQLTIRIGDQQAAILDVRQYQPISPDVFGTNVFPQIGSLSHDQADGTMSYSAPFPQELASAHVGMLRFPGGDWGEKHYLSFDQLSAFSTLLQHTHADGMVQARLSGPIGTDYSQLTDVNARAQIAASWVDFMNNAKSDQRIGKYAQAPYHPVKFWTVGNEPDKLINPATGKIYTVQEYVQDFIVFATAMHKVDPTIKVFGPELSQFNGVGVGPHDATGQLWMDEFLKEIGAYEQAHSVTLLDGVSFHDYPFANTGHDSSIILSSPGSWNYLLPQVHQLIRQYFKQDIPIAVTAINTNTSDTTAPTPGLASLWWGDTLGELMNSGVEYAAFASASGTNNPYPLFTTQNVKATPMFRVMQLFGHLQHNLIPLAIQRDPISLYTTQDDSHQTISMLFINKSNQSQLAQIRPDTQPFATSLW
ncbi:MAG: glycoside hydrolase family 44 protein, partial [Chloroflexota bacterium]|nr:glycoside hydrolase family 44 protein [Chloroflexota bacterium]